MDKRKYRRLASGVEVRFQLEESDRISREYYSGLVDNYSFGGIFIATKVPLSPGDLVNLDIIVPGQPPLVARAMVRWTQRWQSPRGAGLEFIEFDHVGERNFEDWIRQLFESGNPADHSQD